MIKGLAFDKASVRTVDVDGRLHVALSNISKATVSPYYGHEIPGGEEAGLDNDQLYYLLRDPDELAAAAPTFNNIPILSDHIPVSAEAPQQEFVIGSTGTDAKFDFPYLQNSAVIWVQDDINDILTDKKKEWSCAYRYEVEWKKGEFEGLRFDGIMRNIVGNHVALVREGRAGPDVVVGDSLAGVSKMLKSRRALMLNGAVLALVAPKLAQDKRLDLSAHLAGVTAKNLRAKRDGLAAAIVKAAKPMLAKDAGLEVSDVTAIIDALNGTSAAPAEDENDDIPEVEAEPKPAVDADDDKLAQVLAFLKGKLSDEDMAEIGRMCDAGASDEEPDDDDNDDGGEEKVDKKAMDAAVAAARKGAIREANAIREAEAAVEPHVGKVKVALDSAADVYRLALDAKGVDTKGVHPSAFKAMVALLSTDQDDGGQPLAMDHAGARSDFKSRFPTAATLIRS